MEDNQETNTKSQRLQSLANWAQVVSVITAIVAWIWPNPSVDSKSLGVKLALGLVYLVYVAITLLVTPRRVYKPSWNLVRWAGLYLFTALFFLLVGLWCSPSPKCDQITITAIPDQISIQAPTEDDEGTYAEVSYEIQSPDDTSMQILFHWAKHLVDDGTRLVETASGRHFTHYDTRIPRGQTLKLDDGIWIDHNDVENTHEYETNLMTHRLTFYMISEQGYLCKESAAIQVQITGLFPEQ